MSIENSTSSQETIQSLSQTSREKKAIWDRSQVSVLDAQSIQEQVKEHKYFLMPKDTLALVRIGYALSPTEVRHFDLGATNINAELEVGLIKAKGGAFIDIGKITAFTLDSSARRELYESGQGRSALEIEKTLARKFMDERKELLKLPQGKLKLGRINQVQLVVKTFSQNLGKD